MFKKKGQGVIEFVILFGVALLFFTIIIATIQESHTQKNKEKERIVAQNVALSVQDEINLAAGSSDGYERTFQIPKNILGRDYEIGMVQEYVQLNISGYQISYRAVQVTGNLQQGNNIIKKENGIIYLN